MYQTVKLLIHILTDSTVLDQSKHCSSVAVKQRVSQEICTSAVIFFENYLTMQNNDAHHILGARGFSLKLLNNLFHVNNDTHHFCICHRETCFFC